MLKNDITDIFFDLDHTLWDFETNSNKAFEKLLDKHQIPASIDQFLEVYEPINRQYWVDYAKGLKSKDEVKYNRLIDTFKALNVDVTNELIEFLANEYLDFLKKENTLMPGTIEILDYLKDKYHLHILTNGFLEVQADKMTNSGIVHYFEHVITSESVGKLKPHPEVFRHALKQAGTFPHKSFMIGDNLQSDVLGARNIGMNAIHFDPEEQSDIDFKIIPKVKNLIELKEIL
jgi:putative hydrolase of the HAD superfamily